MLVAIIVFVIAYALIIWDKFDRTLVALGGAVAVVLFGAVPATEIFGLIDLHTIILLVSMMIIVEICAQTGIFQYLAIKMIRFSKGSPTMLLVFLSLFTAVASACLDNVTTILIMLPIVITICKDLKINPIPFVIALTFASNIGGTATGIGDPPNLMIMVQSKLSFLSFIENLTPIILVILPITILIFTQIFKKDFNAMKIDFSYINQLDEKTAIKDKPLLKKSLIVLSFTFLGFLFSQPLAELIQRIPGFSGVRYDSTTVAMTGAVVLLAISGLHIERIIKKVEWKTIFFFVGLFMLVGSLNYTGVLQLLGDFVVTTFGSNGLLLAIVILWVSAIASAFVDNIPFTATMIPIILAIGNNPASNMDIVPLWWALALGACLGGSGTIIGASANVIAAGVLEEHGHKISFRYFFRKSFPTMLLTIVISTIYLVIRYYLL